MTHSKELQKELIREGFKPLEFVESGQTIEQYRESFKPEIYITDQNGDLVVCDD